AVAEHLGETEEAFVEQMNAKGQELGLNATRFANAHGLPDPGGRSTAEDLARLTGRLLEDYPASRALLGGATFVYRGRVYSRNIPLFHDPSGVQALKTGFTREAGYNLAVAAWRAGERFVLIVLGATGALPSVAAEAARVHLAPLAHGPVRGLLDGDGAGAALRAPPARDRRRGGAGQDAARGLPLAGLLPRSRGRARAARGRSARHPLQRLPPHARGRPALERS